MAWVICTCLILALNRCKRWRRLPSLVSSATLNYVPLLIRGVEGSRARTKLQWCLRPCRERHWSWHTSRHCMKCIESTFDCFWDCQLIFLHLFCVRHEFIIWVSERASEWSDWVTLGKKLVESATLLLFGPTLSLPTFWITHLWVKCHSFPFTIVGKWRRERNGGDFVHLDCIEGQDVVAKQNL